MLLDWILSFTEGSVKLCKLRCTDTTAQVDFCVVIKDDLSWVLTYRDNVVDGTKCSAMCEAPHVMNSGIIFYMFYCMLPLVEKVTTLLQVLDGVWPCCGNSDSNFLGLNSIHKGVMLDKSSKRSMCV